MLIVGINTGTSCDAIDAVLCKFCNVSPEILSREQALNNKIEQILLNYEEQEIYVHPPRVIVTCSYPFPEELEKRIKSLRSSHEKFSLKEIAILQRDLSLLYVNVVNALLDKWRSQLISTQSTNKSSEKYNIESIKDEITAIGIHGQTIWHEPDEHVTWQMIDPEIISKTLGIDVIYDFRRADIALGGQGAPLTAIQDIILYGSSTYFNTKKDLSPLGNLNSIQKIQSSTQLIFSQNIGGIANMTSFSSQRGNILLCYDQGPGNALMDALAQMEFQQKMDKDGEIARRGKINSKLLSQLLEIQYFHQVPPKTTGIELFGIPLVKKYINQCKNENISLYDLMCTFCELTATCISDSYLDTMKQFCEDPFKMKSAKIITQGGGSKNSYLMERIEHLLKERNPHCQWIFEKSSQVDSKEAILFAILAYLNKKKLAGNVPEITGAKRRCILGSIAYG